MSPLRVGYFIGIVETNAYIHSLTLHIYVYVMKEGLTTFCTGH